MERKKRAKLEFSKLIIILETLLVFIVSWKTLGFIGAAIENEYMGTLPYLTTLLSVVFAAYGTSVSFYYNKAKNENLLKIEGDISDKRRDTD